MRPSSPFNGRPLAGLVVIAGVILGAGACASSQADMRGHFGSAAYQHRAFHLAVTYKDPTSRAIMDKAWRLDNYQHKDGVPTAPKKGRKRMLDLRLDGDGDGVAETKAKIPMFDLRFTHRKTSAHIWFRTAILDEEFEAKELRIIMGHYINSAAGVGQELRINRTRSYSVGESERYKTRVVSISNAKLGTFPGMAATFEISDTPRAAEGEGDWQRSKTVLIRTGFKVQLGKKKWPVLLIAGFTALPSDYGNHVGEFAEFLKRIQVTSYMERLSLRLADTDCKVDPDARVMVEALSDGQPKLRGEGVSNQLRCWKRSLNGFQFKGTPATPGFVPAELEKFREGLNSAPDYVEEAPVAEPQVPDPNVI